MTTEDFKTFKKLRTKDVNKFSKDASNFFYKKRKELNGLTLSKLVEDEFYKRIKRYDDTKNEVLEKSYFNLFSYTSYCFPNRFKDINKMYEDLKNIKGTNLYPYAKKLIEDLLPRALELNDREAEIERLTIYFGRRNELQRALDSMKNEENRKAFDDFIFSLEKWEESYIDSSDNMLCINGKKVGETAVCGVKIGRGNKIHSMEVKVCFDEKEKVYFIGVANFTQWRNSDLVIIDLTENIPDGVKAYFEK
jgi:hypothetical protein